MRNRTRCTADASRNPVSLILGLAQAVFAQSPRPDQVYHRAMMLENQFRELDEDVRLLAQGLRRDAFIVVQLMAAGKELTDFQQQVAEPSSRARCDRSPSVVPVRNIGEMAMIAAGFPGGGRIREDDVRPDGDDPATATNEGFRPLAYGYTDYGSWYQGEITGNYPLGNSNLISHMLRAKMQPSETVTLNLIYYNFTLDHPSALDSGVTSDDWGDEVNFIVDWQATDKVYVIGVLGVLFPGDAAEQWVGGGDDWVYSMLYASWPPATQVARRGRAALPRPWAVESFLTLTHARELALAHVILTGR